MSLVTSTATKVVSLRLVSTIRARSSGKAVTVAQILTLVAFLIESPYLRPIAWATTLIAIIAIWDYYRVAPRAQKRLGA